MDGKQFVEGYGKMKIGTVMHAYLRDSPGEVKQLDSFVADLAAGKNPSPPVLKSNFGAGLVELIVSALAATPAPPTPIPPPTPPPPPAPTGAWPKGGYGVWAPGNGVPSNTSSYDMIVTADWDAASLVKIPKPTLGLVYLSALSCPTPTDRFYGVSAAQAKSNNCALLDSSGNTVENSGYNTSILGDIGSSVYQQLWISNVKAWFNKYPCDGFELDDVVAQLKGYTSSTIPKYPSDSSFATAMVSFVNAIAAAFPDKYVLPNAYAAGGGTTPFVERMKGINGVMLENAFQSGGVGTQSDVKTLLGTGIDVIALCLAPLSGKEAELRAEDNGRGLYMIGA